MTRPSASLTVLALALAAACRSAGGAVDAPRIYEGFGGYHRSITTSSSDTQAWFDQGIQLLYGFNHDEAIRSFREAARLDPDCAMAWWGVAYANGLHINNAQMSEKASQAAWEASREALARLDDESPAERALVEAVATRYAWPVPADRKPLDQAYADRMQRAYESFGDDPDVGALYAESLMDLQPWDLWTKDGEPKGRTLEIVAVLEHVMDIAPLHPGANHFYIHAVEASPDPARAVPAADRLSDLVPGAGHLVHMPSHVYTRVGRYPDASDANERAIAADRAYFALAPPPDFYSIYFLHNVHFLAYAAMMEGRYGKSMEAARRLETEIPPQFLRDWVKIADGLMMTPMHVMIRFGRWEDVLREPRPQDFRLLSLTLWHYGRGVALSALGRTEEARKELAEFEECAARVPEDWTVGNNGSREVIALSRQMLAGELLWREGHADEAFAELREGVRMEDELIYDEPAEAEGWAP